MSTASIEDDNIDMELAIGGGEIVESVEDTAITMPAVNVEEAEVNASLPDYLNEILKHGSPDPLSVVQRSMSSATPRKLSALGPAYQQLEHGVLDGISLGEVSLNEDAIDLEDTRGQVRRSSSSV
jgi:hypothetical protein